MGSVYEVEHTELEKRFVLKALHRELSDRQDLTERLKTERLALAKLAHRNIVTVTDAGTSVDGVAFFVMERLEGETLSDRLKRQGAQPVSEALRIGSAILDGLAAAHRVGVIHRDVKPANVFITYDGSVKLLEFGIAKVAANKTLTANGVGIGTPRYMSPEQARGDQIDARSDIYAAGLLLYEMLAGRGPFSSIRDAADLIYAQLFDAPPPLSEMVDRVDGELDELCSSMLAKEPDERPSSAAELVERLGGLKRRIQNQSEPLPGSTQTTVPGALAPTSVRQNREPPLRSSRSAQGRSVAATSAAREGRSGTEPFRAPPTATRTSRRARSGDSLETHTNTAPARKQKSSSSRAVWAIVGIGAAGVLAAVGWQMFSPRLSSQSQRSPVATTPATAPPAVPQPEPVHSAPSPPAPVERVKLVVVSSPAGADVYRQSSNMRVGQTPYEVSLDAGEGEIVFTLVKAGHQRETVAMPAGESGERRVSLVRTRRSQPKRTPKPAPKPEARVQPAPSPQPAPAPGAEADDAPDFDESSDDRTINPWN